MLSKRKLDLFLISIFLLFSIWLMNKSFGYSGKDGVFYISRHQVGDFGLHFSLIRSFSWGKNMPIESPFFPGKPLAYHYYFDLAVGMLEKLGLRIDLAFNGLSVISLTTLLYFIYKLPQKIFGESKMLGVFSVVLFIFHSSLTFVDFFRGKKISLQLLQDLWVLPNYIHIGPFDGSLISTFFTFNVFLNQRHLIASLALALGIIYVLIPTFFNSHKISTWFLISLGLLLGISSRIHILIFLSMIILLFSLSMLFKKYRLIFYLILPALIIFTFQSKDILTQGINHPIFNPGFLAQKPLTVGSFLTYWILNLGFAFFIIPIAVFLSKAPQRKLFFAVFTLFIIGNVFQLSFRIDHNHSLFNFFLIFANFYIAFFLARFWMIDALKKIVVVVLLFLLTISGVIDLMALKNDFRYPIALGPENKFLNWIKDNTKKQDIFLAKQEILDPVTLSGRRNYLGHKYYLEVMGYDTRERERLVEGFFETEDSSVFARMRKENISYILIPQKPKSDFYYKINTLLFKSNIAISYQDDNVIVFKL